jgi:hypothetical protein
MTSCKALVCEAMQRTYRNAVLDFIRSGMEAAYPDDYEDRVRSAFGSCDDIVSRCQVRGHRSGVRFGRAYVEDGGLRRPCQDLRQDVHHLGDLG